MAMDSVSTDTISRIAQNTFGARVEVPCIREISPSKSHGITETPASTRNLLYVVELKRHPHPYVFRFSRVEDDVYDQEVQNYRLLANETGVRVPTIYALDTSREIVPTSYMVMDYLPGKLWNYVAHPDNPTTEQVDKAQIAEAVGGFYARVHRVKSEHDESGIEARTLLHTVDRLERARQKGNVDVPASEIDRCREAILEEPAFQRTELTLCLADTEVHVKQNGNRWDLAFICDAEWVEFRHRFSDLTQVLGGPLPWWRLEEPAPYLDPDEVSRLPFFRGYDPDRKLDMRRLLRLAAYYQLGLWAYIAMSAQSPAKRSWVKEAKGPLIQELIRIVSRQAEREQITVSVN